LHERAKFLQLAFTDEGSKQCCHHLQVLYAFTAKCEELEGGQGDRKVDKESVLKCYGKALEKYPTQQFVAEVADVVTSNCYQLQVSQYFLQQYHVG
jgi:hypothetical protein